MLHPISNKVIWRWDLSLKSHPKDFPGRRTLFWEKNFISTCAFVLIPNCIINILYVHDIIIEIKYV